MTTSPGTLPPHLKSRRRRRVLLLPLEFFPWQRAKPLSYPGQLGLEEGFAANGVDVTTIPALCEVPSDSRGSWLSRFDRLVGRQRFDQVWIWVCHAHYDDRLLDRLMELAPVRVGVLVESLQYTAAERKEVPSAHDYRRRVFEQSRALTHIVAGDEVDVEALGTELNTRTLWWPGTVPGRLLSPVPRVLPRTAAAFLGTPYGDRARMLADPRIKRLVACPPSPDDASQCPALFDTLFTNAHEYLVTGGNVANAQLSEFVSAWRAIRRMSFETYMASLQTWSAVVALPSYLKTYAGRVVEGMAAGRPVVSWRIPQRPRNMALFIEGEEILLYPRHDPAALAETLLRLKRDRALARRIACAAQSVVRQHHTIEARIRQAVQWIDTGNLPDYGERGLSAKGRTRPMAKAPAAATNLRAEVPAPSAAGTEESGLASPQQAASWVSRLLQDAGEFTAATEPHAGRRLRQVLTVNCPDDWIDRIQTVARRRARTEPRHIRWTPQPVDLKVARVGPSRNAPLVLWGGRIPRESGDTLAAFGVLLHNLVAAGGTVLLVGDRVDGAQHTLSRLGFDLIPARDPSLKGRLLRRNATDGRFTTSGPDSPSSLRSHAIRATIMHADVATGAQDGRMLDVLDWRPLIDQLRSASAKRMLICYGTGARARTLIALLRSVDIDIAACVDRDRSKVGSQVCGLRVHEPRWLRRRLDDPQPPFVIIGSSFVHDITRQLQSIGFAAADFMAM